MAGVTILKVKAEDDGIRLNRWFLKYYPGLPLARLQKLLRTKQIKVDGKRAEVSLKLLAGQEIRIPPMEDRPIEKSAAKVSDKDAEFVRSLVIYKDDNIIVLNKPSGLAVQGGTNTLHHVDGMLDALKFEKEDAPKLVHRIDKETSGVLVLARDRKNAEILTKAFRERDLNKTYLALVRGSPKKTQGEIKANLLKAGEKMKVDADGKKAITEYKVLDATGNKFALIEAKPMTGRTHQIRAHLEYLGVPIVGDDKYFGKGREKFAMLKDKLYLHAYKIDLSGIYRNLQITAKLPDYFIEALTTLGLNFKE